MSEKDSSNEETMNEAIKSGDFMAIQGHTPVFTDVVGYYSNPTLANEGEDLMALNRGGEASEFLPSHVQMIVKVNPEILFGQKDSIIVVSCDPNGVQCRSVREEEWQQPWRIMGLKPGLEFKEEELKDVLGFCFSTTRHGYDYAGCFADFPLNADLQDQHSWFCSEHVFMSYWIGRRPLQERLKAAFAKPRDCYISPIVMIKAKGGGL